MSAEKWKQINDLFHAALDIAPSHRPDFLKQHCDDPSVLEEVASLLEAHKDAGSFIDTPIVPGIMERIEEQHELLAAGQVVGQYQILHAIGKGGMGAVYLGVRADEAYEKHVAIKVVKRGMDSAEIVRHFRNERQILADFDHPNIARLLDGGTTDSGVPYFVMEYVEGLPIDEYCYSNKLEVNDRLELFRQVCAAVAYAHRRLVIHRDIKPSNIFVTADGVPKLLDFGIAKILDTDRDAASTATGLRLMTPEYASPEQALGLPVTTVSDVYSLGVLLYEILTGRPPYEFESRSPMEIARVINDTHPLLPSVVIGLTEDGSANRSGSMTIGATITVDQLKRRLRGDLDNIVLMALRKEPQRRYQSVEQFSEDIRRHIVGLPVIARKDTVVYRLTKFTRRNRFAVTAAFLILLTLIGGVITTTWQARRAKAEQSRAEYAREFADELRYLESLLLNTYSAPLHDTRPQLNLARKRLKQMEERMLRAGDLASGAGHNAIGNGYLLLKDYDLARTHLEQAWNSGYREPSAAYALGKALGNLYHQALQTAGRISNRAIREQQQREAEEKFARPAVEFLSQARTNAESPAYVEGLIALYQKKFEEALRKTNEAFQSSSRPYEVVKLEGDIHFQIGTRDVGHGNYDAAAKSYALAGKAYERAAEIARSDAEIYLANAHRLSRMIAMQNVVADSLVQSALQVCNQAIQINPDDPRAYFTKAEVYIQQGVNQMYYTHLDPRPAFLNSAAQAEQSLRLKKSASAYERISRAYLRIGEYETTNGLDSRNALNISISNAKKMAALELHAADAYLNLASAYFYLAEYQLNHGEDPNLSLKEIIGIYDNNLAGYPKDTFALNLLALTHVSLGEYRMKRGIDPRPDFEKALTYYKEALQKNLRSSYLYSGMGVALLYLSKFEMNNGIAPDETLQRGIEAYEKSIELTPEGYDAYNRGLLYLGRAEHRIRIRQNPEQDLQLALKDFQRILERFPEFRHAQVQTAAVSVLAGRYHLIRGGDPAPDLKNASRLLNEFVRRDQTNPEAFLLLGTANALLARWEVKKQRSPDALWEHAVSNLTKCLELNRSELSGYVELAAVYRDRAQSDPVSSAVWIERGLQTAAEAEKLHPQHAEILALRGTLLLLKSETGENGVRKQGIDFLKRAIELNHFLRWDYGVAAGK